MTPEQIEKLVAFAAYYANCPCCDENDVCVNDCTFHDDDPLGYDVMLQAREALKGAQ